MIQYLGLSFVLEPAGPRAVAVAVDRGAQVIGRSSVPVGGVTRGEKGTIDIRPGEWVRAGVLALKDVFFRIPAKVRKVWGFSLSGPHGWIALDPDLEPLGPVRLTPAPLADLLSSLAAHPRERAHIYAVLSPKDYFRLALSGALATDVTQAEPFGLLEPGRARWSRERLAELDLPPSWFPPVFDSPVATGRISEEGIRRSGLPGGLWVVAGAAQGEGSLISAGDLRSGLVLACALDAETLEIRLLAAGVEEDRAQEGFETVRAPLAGHRVLRRTLRIQGEAAEAGAAAAGAVREAFDRFRKTPVPGLKPPERIVLDYRPAAAPLWGKALLSGGGAPAELSRFAGAEDPGIAFLAGLAQGGFRTLDVLYRKLREAREEEAPAARGPEAPAGGEEPKAGPGSPEGPA